MKATVYFLTLLALAACATPSEEGANGATERYLGGFRESAGTRQ